LEKYLDNKHHVHFIGIGGSGMYPLAQILHKKGYYITGSDNNETSTLDAIRKMGIKVYFGQRAENIDGADLIVHTAAIMEDNPELIAARESGVTTIERKYLLGEITSWFENCIGVCGTHGKTTATSMLTHIFLGDNSDISAFIGGKLKAISGSAKLGTNNTMVCEACEFSNTFLEMQCSSAVVLNIDADHLNFFKTMDNLKAAFTKFCDKASDLIVYNGDDKNTIEAVSKTISTARKITFGFDKSNDFYAEDIKKLSDFKTSFVLKSKTGISEELVICVPGKHNVLNAVAVSAIALSQKNPVKIEGLKKGLYEFKGTARRFELLDEINSITVADDYAHHPTEIEATLKTAKNMSFNRVWAVHQPFTYSRTATLIDDFAKVLSIADKVVLTEIMGSREKNTYNIYSKDLAEKIDGCTWFSTFDQVAEYVAENAMPNDLIITLGCGDVYKVAIKIIELLKKSKS